MEQLDAAASATDLKARKLCAPLWNDGGAQSVLRILDTGDERWRAIHGYSVSGASIRGHRVCGSFQRAPWAGGPRVEEASPGKPTKPRPACRADRTDRSEATMKRDGKPRRSGFLYERSWREEANSRGENHWYEYGREIGEQMGLDWEDVELASLTPEGLDEYACLVVPARDAGKWPEAARN